MKEDREVAADELRRKYSLVSKMLQRLTTTKINLSKAREEVQEAARVAYLGVVPNITDHALIRYLERHTSVKMKKHFDTLSYLVSSQVDDAVLNSETPHTVYIIDPRGQNMRVVVKNGAVITVM